MQNATAKTVTLQDLGAFADAWNRHDVDALMEFMTDDCVFEASVGPDICGKQYVGAAAVRDGFERFFESFPDAHWGEAKHFIAGDRGVSEWIFTGTKADGKKIKVNGCDIFTFKNGKISKKNSYRKNPTI